MLQPWAAGILAFVEGPGRVSQTLQHQEGAGTSDCIGGHVSRRPRLLCMAALCSISVVHFGAARGTSAGGGLCAARATA